MQHPEPEERDLSTLFPDLIHENTGVFEYQETDYSLPNEAATVTNINLQGPMGYGIPPIGTGTIPYKSFLSNKVKRVSSPDAPYTGHSSSDKVPSITFKQLSHLGVGVTYAAGIGKQQFNVCTDL